MIVLLWWCLLFDVGHSQHLMKQGCKPFIFNLFGASSFSLFAQRINSSQFMNWMLPNHMPCQDPDWNIES